MSEQLLKPVITDTGITTSINARNSGVQARIVKVQVGDGNGASYTPEATATALKNKIQEVAVSGTELIGQKNNQLHITATIKDVPIPGIDLPDSYAINEIGFLLDTGELFALYSPGTNQKIADKVKGTDFLLAFDLTLTGESADNIVIDGSGDLDLPAVADNILLGPNTIKIHTQVEFDNVFNQGTDTVVPANSTIALSPIQGMYQPNDMGRWQLLHEITAFADSTTDPGTKITCTSAAHGLSEGAAIFILQSQHHDGNYSVSNVTTNSFDIPATFVATGSAKWGTSVYADITAFADSTTESGTKITCTSTAHGLSVGDTLLLAQSHYYTGIYTLANVDTNSFDIDAPFIVGDINDGAWGGTGDATENTFNGRPAYVLKNSVILSESVSIIGFNQEDTLVVKDDANTRITIQGSSGTPVTGIHLQGWSFDGRGGVDSLGGSLSGTSNGGAFYLDYCERSELNCKIINHMTSADGGGVYGANAVKQITATQLHHNSAANGGGVVNCDDSTLTVYNCSATTSGSGVEACDNALLRLFNCEAANSTGGVVVEDNNLQVQVEGVTTLNRNVGIGTTTPGAKLAVNGGLHVGGDSDPGDNNLEVDGNINASAGKIKEAGNDLLPAGSIFPYAGETAPGGYLHCDGTAVSRSTYADLLSVIGVMYGDGDGSTTFNLPDYRGYFLRGWDDGGGNDPDAGSRTDRGDTTIGDAVGTKQADEFESHNHGIRNLGAFGINKNVDELMFGARYPRELIAYEGGNETRPKNINVMYLIKY